MGCSWDFFRGEYPPTSLSGLGRHEAGGIISHPQPRVYNIANFLNNRNGWQRGFKQMKSITQQAQHKNTRGKRRGSLKW